MANISAKMVAELRAKSGGAGMMECKKALVEANGDLNEALKIIAKSGQRKAAKSAARTAAEGKIFMAAHGNTAYMLEVNCETDFVGRDESFNKFSQNLIDLIAGNDIESIEALSAAKYDDKQSVEEAREQLIVRIGENIQLRRIGKLSAKGQLGSYLHNGRIGSLVDIDGGDEQLARDIAMQAAAMPFEYISPDQVPQSRVDSEKEILIAQAADSGKPPEIIEKMIQGRLSKFLNEICLTGQPFVKDQDQTVEKVLKAAKAKINNVVRFQLGEGIEKEEVDFAAEVAQQLQGK